MKPARKYAWAIVAKAEDSRAKVLGIFLEKSQAVQAKLAAEPLYDVPDDIQVLEVRLTFLSPVRVTRR